MAISYIKQYKPVSDLETATDTPVSVRAILDLADGINNYKACVGNQKVVFQLFSNPMYASDGTGAAGSSAPVVRRLYPRYIPDGYDSFAVHAIGKGNDATNTCTAYFYVILTKLYLEDDNISTGTYEAKGQAAVITIDGGNTSYQLDIATADGLDRGGGYYYVTIAADLEYGGSVPTTLPQLTTLDVTPMIKERI